MALVSFNRTRDREGASIRNEPSLPMPAVPSRLGRTLAANELLFGRGEPRTHVFRVESGAVCLYESPRADDQTVIEFVFPGDYVGFGFLEKHSLTARALVDTSVTCIPVDTIEDVIKDDLRAQAKLAAAIEREFESRREELTKAAQQRPVERVAALLIASARINAQEGRQADRIEESWQCGYIADLLGVDLDDLTGILVELKRQGLIEAAGDGIRLKDMPALDALADRSRPKCYRARDAGMRGRTAKLTDSCQAA